MNSPSPSPAASTSQTDPKPGRGPAWSAREETALVNAVRAAKAVGGTPAAVWEAVQARFVEQGFPARPLRGIQKHYSVLKKRAEAQGVPLAGPVPQEAWSTAEQAAVLAVFDLEQEAAEREGRRLESVSWRCYRSSTLFARHSDYDLSKRLSNVQRWLKTPSEKLAYQTKLAELNSERAQARVQLLNLFPHLRAPASLPPPSSAINAPAQPSPASTPTLATSPFIMCPPTSLLAGLSSYPATNPSPYPRPFPSAATPAHAPTSPPSSTGTKRRTNAWEEGRILMRRIKQRLEDLEGSSDEEEGV